MNHLHFSFLGFLPTIIYSCKTFHPHFAEIGEPKKGCAIFTLVICKTKYMENFAFVLRELSNM